MDQLQAARARIRHLLLLAAHNTFKTPDDAKDWLADRMGCHPQDFSLRNLTLDQIDQADAILTQIIENNRA